MLTFSKRKLNTANDKCRLKFLIHQKLILENFLLIKVQTSLNGLRNVGD